MKVSIVLAATAATLGFGCAGRVDRPSPAELLGQARLATSQTDYEGLMETQTIHQNRWLTCQIKAYFHGPGMSRLEYLDSHMKGLVIGKVGNLAWQMHPDSHEVVVTQGAASAPTDRDSLTASNYNITARTHVTVAGRDAIELELKPKQPDNPLRRYWVDSETHVLLGWERMRADGARQCITQFQTVEFKSEPESLFQPPQTKKLETSPVQLQHPMTLAELQKVVKFPLTLPRWLPHGYRSTVHYKTECEDGCRAPVAMSRITDGQNTLYFFQGRHIIDPADPDGGDGKNDHDADDVLAEPPAQPPHTGTGGMHIARVVRNNTNYVLVGSLGSKQLQKIISSIPPLSKAP